MWDGVAMPATPMFSVIYLSSMNKCQVVVELCWPVASCMPRQCALLSSAAVLECKLIGFINAIQTGAGALFLLKKSLLVLSTVKSLQLLR